MDSWPLALVLCAAAVVACFIARQEPEKIDPANVQAVAQTCAAKGLVAYVSRTAGQLLIECRQPEGEKK